MARRAAATPSKSTQKRAARTGSRGDAGRAPRAAGNRKPASRIRFTARLLRPKAAADGGAAAAAADRDWAFLILPKQASAKLPSRGQVSVEGEFNGAAFQTTLEPDGKGGHWMKVDRELCDALARAGVQQPEVGQEVELEIEPLPPDRAPEPKVPDDLRKALAAASPKAREVWSDITPVARRDWIHWIVSAKQAATRQRRITNACDMLAKGKRRPCCFDRSGMYSNSLSCPVADDA